MDKIIAIADCNNFYVSCERLFDPRLNQCPTVVLTNNDGSVISRSAEAKKLGIRKGEKFYDIQKLVKKERIRFYSSNYTLYADISERVFSVFKEKVSRVEIYSIDEVFLDLSDLDPDRVEEFLLEIKTEVYRRTGIPVSIGAGPTKTLAKLANKISKEGRGVYFMRDREKFLKDNLDRFDFDDIWGIGIRSKEKILGLGCQNLLDFINYSPSAIRKKLTVTGLRTQMELKGVPCFEVETTFKTRKNISTSRTFGYSTSDLSQVQKATHFYVQKAAAKLKRENLLAQSFTLFLCNDRHKEKEYYSEVFKIKLIRATQDEFEIWSQVQKVLLDNYKPHIRYRKSAVCLTDLIPIGRFQTLIFEDMVKPIPYVEPIGNEWQMRRSYLSRKYTSNWDDLPTVTRIEDF